ncbi:MAG: hypothetical protein EA361_05485 [Bacteroidetes bacterium]|nr:MAG: hypothetical protein EA361_05485 [Bacteroidota bacterium]
MKRKAFLPLVILLVFIIGCTQQSRLSSRLSAEWNIAKFEARTFEGSTSSIENAGTLVLRSNGRGTQSFTSSIAHAGDQASTDFEWNNTDRTVSIMAQGASVPKIWIVVDSSRSKQLWYSTDSSGNVQIMHLEKK